MNYTRLTLLLNLESLIRSNLFSDICLKNIELVVEKFIVKKVISESIFLLK